MNCVHGRDINRGRRTKMNKNVIYVKAKKPTCTALMRLWRCCITWLPGDGLPRSIISDRPDHVSLNIIVITTIISLNTRPLQPNLLV